MSQKVRISGVLVDGAVFVGCRTPVTDSGERILGPGTPTWVTDPSEVMSWLCDGWRSRYNQLRAWRGGHVWEDDPNQPGTRRRVCDDTGEPILVPLGSDPQALTDTQARLLFPHLAALPSLVLQSPEKVENTDWYAAVKRRSTLTGKGRFGGRMPRFRSKHDDARFVCWFNGGRNAVLTRTGRRSGVVTITGQNPTAWKGPHPQKWRVRIQVRLSQPIRDYTSIRVNWTRNELVFVNEPAACRKTGPTGAQVGLDVGVAHTIATSDGIFFDQPATTAVDARIQHHQKAMARSRRVNNPDNLKNQSPTGRYRKHRQLLTKAHADKVRQLDDWRHKTTTMLVTTYDLIAVEDLKVAAMTRSAKGTVAAPGSNVAAKAGLNRSLAQAAFATLRSMLAYKTAALIKAGHISQQLIAVPAHNTSRRCRICGHTAAENRKSQTVFCCIQCGHQTNADVNAAGNVLDRATKPNGGGLPLRGIGYESETPTRVRAPGHGSNRAGNTTPVPLQSRTILHHRHHAGPGIPVL